MGKLVKEWFVAILGLVMGVAALVFFGSAALGWFQHHSLAYIVRHVLGTIVFAAAVVVGVGKGVAAPDGSWEKRFYELLTVVLLVVACVLYY